MNYKRICTLLGIIIALSFAVLCIKSIKVDIELNNEIESRLGFSDEQKRAVKYKDLVEDIKLASKGSMIKNAKADKGNDNKGIVSVIAEKDYYGEGYIVKYIPSDDAYIYDFYVNDETVYTVITNTGWGKDGNQGTLNILVRKLINYGLFGIMILAEIIFYVLYKKNLKKKNDEEEQDEKNFKNEKEAVEDKKLV